MYKVSRFQPQEGGNNIDALRLSGLSKCKILACKWMNMRERYYDMDRSSYTTKHLMLNLTEKYGSKAHAYAVDNRGGAEGCGHDGGAALTLVDDGRWQPGR